MQRGSLLRKQVWRRLRAGGSGGSGAAINFTDGFDVNTAASYTAGGDTPTTWTWDTANSRLTAADGSQATLLRTGFTTAFPFVEADYDQAFESGLIIHYVDNNNYYICTVNDDSGASPNYTLYKRVASAFTSLGSSDVTWVRGGARTLRLAREGGNIVLREGGVAIITVSDSSFTSAGGLGLRQSSSTGVLSRVLRLQGGSTA